ncbi:putative Transcriptional regulator, MerR family [Vibrio nigripulchritudo SO65]|uniref:MerR family transcriptional regulator n=1 Tax=Vibrio nigripulchritudo TaxID=28173 RepID=UPI0003B22557|nr:MerR family transcriptional regulator [Vibrio nigripulchritudo]CCN34247.1 putative Transcriptional regulator, MerR family [Vibrio nigripulchritudo AM115]CCN44072.1 putative Transcriptional regulator, MerR family [Vibrio nigripulchritudo FTn2]CCN64271.1 putative Transcriptional regulator, MerR family [Vibrio nigripulchritudo POn4]CCN78489.1 putative Transcriptional regulator, MerR family [Vibrio nigripulchritudo SO65]
MYIGELSKKTGVSVKAIRHYEDIALIKSPQRDGKYRVYDDSYIQVLGMIKAAKGLGFTLEELRTIAKAKSQEGLVPMDLLKAELQKKRTNILIKKAELEKRLEEMDELEISVQHYNQCLLENINQ